MIPEVDFAEVDLNTDWIGAEVFMAYLRDGSPQFASNRDGMIKWLCANIKRFKEPLSIITYVDKQTYTISEFFEVFVPEMKKPPKQKQSVRNKIRYLRWLYS